MHLYQRISECVEALHVEVHTRSVFGALLTGNEPRDYDRPGGTSLNPSFPYFHGG